MQITQGAISEQARGSKMPAVEEEEGGIKRALVSPLKRKMKEVEEEGEEGIKRALVSPLKRKTGGIIEMWITDESYASPVKEAKVLESLDLADDLNLEEEKVEKTGEMEEVLNGTVDSSCSSSVNFSDLLESSADPDIEIKEVELGDESVGADDESCAKFPSDKVSLSCDTGGQTFPKGGKEEERQLVYKHLKVKDDGEHETQAKTEEGENYHKLERTEEEWGASEKSNEQVKHETTNVKEDAETSQGNSVEVKNLGDEPKGFSKHHKVPVEDRKLPIEVVDLDSEEEEESIHRSAGGVTVRFVSSGVFSYIC